MARTRMLTKQAVFDRVIKHLVKQGIPAKDYEENACLYRLDTPNGVLKCAVGCLISDKNYSPAIEHNRASDLSVQLAVKRTARRPMEEGMVNLLESLQTLHDNREFESGFVTESSKAYFVQCARAIADTYDLNTKVLENI